jgi:soluble lytic murein transglycosylase-like protein
MRLLEDGGPPKNPTIALTRAILLTNPRLGPVDALNLAGAAVAAARTNGLPPEFVGATLLQESAFDPAAISAAGAVGIAQFMPSTAADYGVDPFDPYAAIGASAALLGSYVRAYGGGGKAYLLALAAYNAGPAAVAAYGGVPPYPETHGYIDDVAERWAKISGYEAPIGAQ